MTKDSDAIADLLERRWFAINNACMAQRHECDHIRQSLEAAEAAWRRAYERLRELELMRESLGSTLAELDASGDRCADLPGPGSVRRAMSAA